MFIKRKTTNHKILWQAKEAAAISGGKNSCDWAATGVSINVDHVESGDLFFAAHGDDLDKVLKCGAAAVVLPHGMSAPENLPCLKVANTFETLRSFAKIARYKTHALIIAVQGEQERETVTQTLSTIACVHEGGRHMSMGLASLPENIPYGVFGLSPAAMPDVSVITDPAKAAHSRVFSSMKTSGIVLINDNAPGYIECLAAMRSFGLRHIITFEEAAHMNLKMFGNKTMQRALKAMAESLIIQNRAANIKTLDPLKLGEHYTAFKVKNMVDLGHACKTLILGSILDKNNKDTLHGAKDLEVPERIGGFNLVYTSRHMSLTKDMQTALQKNKQNQMKDVVPEVLMPGDYVVLKKPVSANKVKFSSALRTIASAR